MLNIAVATMIGPSFGYGSPACMTESEARAKFPKPTHLYMRRRCWSDGAVVHSPQLPARTAAPAPSALPALAVAPAPSLAPATVNTGIDAGARCRVSRHVSRTVESNATFWQLGDIRRDPPRLIFGEHGIK